MPFNRRWDKDLETYVVDRELTGPPPPPETGTIVEESGMVVADSAAVSIPPATPVRVKIPGPRERVIDASGNMTPRWRRFFEELYRRTGAIEDNINRTSRSLAGTGTTGIAALAGAAPTIKIEFIQSPSGGALSIASEAPTVA